MKALLAVWDALLTLSMAWMTKKAIDDSEYGTAAFLALVLLVSAAHDIVNRRNS